MKNFRTFHLAVEFYHLCSELNLKGPLRDQLNRASSSVALNLAEGRGKLSRKEQKRFFSIAFASLRECQAALILARLDSSPASATADKLAAHIYRLIEKA